MSNKIWTRRRKVNLGDDRHVKSMLTCDIKFMGRAETIWEREVDTPNKWLLPALGLFDESESGDTLMGSGFVGWRQLLSEESVITLSRAGGDTCEGVAKTFVYIRK
jgi:hypothetical protein